MERKSVTGLKAGLMPWTSHILKEGLVFYQNKYSRLSAYSDWLLKESVDISTAQTPFCI